MSVSHAPSTDRWQAGESEELTRARVIRLAFNGEADRFAEFVTALREVTPPISSVILRGSAVTGHRWGGDEPFDADGVGTSDLDVTFVGGGLVRHWKSFHIPGLHSVPLSDAHPDACPPLVPLRGCLSALAGRPVTLQATRSLVQFVRDVVMNQPYLTLIEKTEEHDDEDDAAGDDEDWPR
jgi:hypothetical protein